MPIQDYYETFRIINKTIIPDAFGANIKYVEGELMKGAVSAKSAGASFNSKPLIAESQGTSTTYSVTINKSDSLPYNTIIKRKNGQYLKIVSDERDGIPPSISTFDWKTLTAETFNIPKEGFGG